MMAVTQKLTKENIGSSVATDTLAILPGELLRAAIRLWSLTLASMGDLGWWLAHPYRKQSAPVHHPTPAAEAASSYGRENMASGVSPVDNPADAPSFGYAALGFFIPVAGLVLYLVWKEQTPLRAKSAGKGALAGVIVWISLSILMAILAFVLPMIMLRGYY